MPWWPTYFSPHTSPSNVMFIAGHMVSGRFNPQVDSKSFDINVILPPRSLDVKDVPPQK